MKHSSKRCRSDAIVSASELAQMGRCEQLVLFEHRHGHRRLPHQEAARRQGLAAHERFEQKAWPFARLACAAPYAALSPVCSSARPGRPKRFVSSGTRYCAREDGGVA